MYYIHVQIDECSRLESDFCFESVWYLFHNKGKMLFKNSSSHQGGWTFTIKCVVNTTPHLGWTKIPSTVGKYSKIKDNANPEVFIFHIRLKLYCFGTMIGLLSNFKKINRQIWFAQIDMLNSISWFTYPIKTEKIKF